MGRKGFGPDEVFASIASRTAFEMRPTCTRVASSISTAINNLFPTRPYSVSQRRTMSSAACDA